MPTIIRLDREALNNLFPEGTDARVQLQHAIVQEFVRHKVKDVVDETIVEGLVTKAIDTVKLVLREEVTAAIKKEIGEYQLWPSKVTVSLTLVEKAKAEIASQASALISDCIQKYINKEAIEAQVKASVNYNIVHEVKKQVRDKLDAAKEAL